MSPLFRALFSAWEWRPFVSLLLGGLTTLYLLGWLRLRRQRVNSRLATRWRLGAYLSGMAILALALMSPIDILGGQLLFMHMIQHKLTVMAAAPLLWLGNPFPIGLWGLPGPLRKTVATLFTHRSWFRQALTAVTAPGVTWLVFIVVYIGWHDPNLYNLALRVDWVHDLQHITFFVAALLFWWPVVGAAPHLHQRFSPWVAIAYLMLAVVPNAIAGVVIANSSSLIYTYYASAPRIWGFTTLQDQATGGMIMWIQGSEMLMQAALIVLIVHLSQERRKGENAATVKRAVSAA